MPPVLQSKARTLAADDLSQNWSTSALQFLSSSRPFAAAMLSALVVALVKGPQASSPFGSAPLPHLVPSRTALWSTWGRSRELCCAHSEPKQTRGFQWFCWHKCLQCVPVSFADPTPWTAILFPFYRILVGFGWVVVITSPFPLLALWMSLEDQSFPAQSETRPCPYPRLLTVWTTSNSHSP